MKRAAILLPTIGMLMVVLAMTIDVSLPVQYYDETTSLPVGSTVIRTAVGGLEGDGVKIRLLILKHCREQMANDDADLALRAVRAASAKGLQIKSVGNHVIDRRSAMKVVVWEYESLTGLKNFVSEEMKRDAEYGDTMILFTIGHGHQDGLLQTLGSRSEVMHALADAAGENQQKTFWWQLSCHALGNLPPIHSLPADQQEYFSVLPTSSPENVSPAGWEGEIMEKVFVAIAEKSPSIDPNYDNEITGGELRDFLNQKVRAGRGSLLQIRSMNDVIFGLGLSLANQIPIIDRNNPQGQYNKKYIPSPRK